MQEFVHMCTMHVKLCLLNIFTLTIIIVLLLEARVIMISVRCLYLNTLSKFFFFYWLAKSWPNLIIDQMIFLTSSQIIMYMHVKLTSQPALIVTSDLLLSLGEWIYCTQIIMRTSTLQHIHYHGENTIKLFLNPYYFYCVTHKIITQSGLVITNSFHILII